MTAPPPTRDRFVIEPIHPLPGTFDTRAMARGEPGLPQRFTWRGKDYEVADVLERRRETGPMKGGGEELYVRKHWATILTTSGHRMTLYFERQPRSRRDARRRWWLFSVTEPDP